MNEQRSLAPVAPLVIAFCGLVAAIYIGYLIGDNQSDSLLQIGLGLLLIATLGFVGNYWWAPLLLISALTFRTNFLGFMMTGIDIGVLVLAFLLPLKMSVRRLRLIDDNPPIGRAFILLFTYIALHAVIIILYNKYEGAMGLKNIIKAYYALLSPLVFYGLVRRYCQPSTIKPVTIWLFAMYGIVLAISIPVVLANVQVPFLASQHFMFDWTHAGVAIGAMRNYAPIVFAVALAFWPAAKSFPVRFLLILMAVIAVLGALFSASRVAPVVCLSEAALFCIMRRRWWLIVPVLTGVVVVAGVISQNPNSLYALPPPVHRALTPFNFSAHQTDVQTAARGSDEWHEDLRRDSFEYWFSDPGAFLFGHGFKGWDESLSYDPAWTRYYEDAKRLAVQTGRPENALNSITNILGLVGLLLYAALLWHIGRQLVKGRKETPPGSFARSLCDFSFVTLITFVVFAPVAGGSPGISVVYWQLGYLAVHAHSRKKKLANTPAPGLQHRQLAYSG